MKTKRHYKKHSRGRKTAHRRRHISRHKKMRGGSYSSASSYGTYVNGTADAQYNRVFDQSGQYGQVPGNVIIGQQGQNLVSAARMPTASELSLVQKAGSKNRRGGFLGQVINQAIVPFGLLGLQQTYRRKNKKHTRRH